MRKIVLIVVLCIFSFPSFVFSDECFISNYAAPFDMRYCYGNEIVTFYSNTLLPGKKYPYQKIPIKLKGILYESPIGSFLVVNGIPFKISIIPWEAITID